MNAKCQRYKCDYALHLRGSVYMRVKPNLWRKSGYAQVWYWGVVNASTGERFATDNTGCTHAEAMDHCARVVTAARIGWMQRFTRKQLAK